MASVELTNVAAVRQFMQKTAADKLQDSDIEVLIPQASEAIQRICNREFVSSASKTRSFELYPTVAPTGSGFELIDLVPYEYRTVEEVTIDPEIAPIVLKTSQYRQWPYPSRDGTFFGLRFTGLEEVILPKGFPGEGATPFQTRRLDVKATWGMTEVPAEIVHWTNVTVESWLHLRRDPGMGPQVGELAEAPVLRGYDLPPGVFYGLKRWMRPTPAC